VSEQTYQIAYAACAWALVFAAFSFFWGVGGELGFYAEQVLREM
jgi:hypothetical protein